MVSSSSFPAYRILLIDDDEDDYWLINDAFSHASRGRYEVRWEDTYESGQAALREEQGFDAVLLDYFLGARNGLELLRELNADSCPFPFILFTGQSKAEVDLAVLEAGATLYFSKDEINTASLERGIQYAVRLKQKEEDLKRANAELAERNATLRHQQQALIEQEARYSTLVNLSPDGVLVHIESKIVFINRAGLALLGAKQQEEILGRSILDLLHPNDHSLVKERIRAVIEEGRTVPAFEETFLRLNGSTVDVEVAGAAIVYEGKPAMLVLARDVSERKAADRQLRSALQEKDILLRELYHRTKNNMQVVSSLLSLQRMETENEETRAILSAMENRILSMALVHQKLYQSKNLSSIDLGEYLKELITRLDDLQGDAGRVTVQYDVHPVQVMIETAIPCGLVINEVVTNAFKHAFPNGREGTLWIGLRQDETGLITLSVRDDGVGFPPGFDPRRGGGLGFQLIQGLVESQMRGKMTFTSEHGTQFTAQFQDTPYPARV